MSTSRTKPAAAKPSGVFGCLSIGYRDYLLPADKALKVLALMQEAQECDQRFTGGKNTYVLTGPVRLQYAVVQAADVRMDQPEQEARGTTAALPLEQPKLAYSRSRS